MGHTLMIRLDNFRRDIYLDTWVDTDVSSCDIKSDIL